jgi:hypothetical protein
LITPAADASEKWEALRACWLDLKDPSMASSEGAAFSGDLLRRHDDALRGLQAGGQLDADVAAAMAIAFEEAVTHVQRKMATCYEPVPSDQPDPYASREELTTQAAALAEMAERSAIDRDTIARAQAALERDLAWLARFQAGPASGDLGVVKPSPAESEAARVLVQLLIGESIP